MKRTKCWCRRARAPPCHSCSEPSSAATLKDNKIPYIFLAGDPVAEEPVGHQDLHARTADGARRAEDLRAGADRSAQRRRRTRSQSMTSPRQCSCLGTKSPASTWRRSTTSRRRPRVQRSPQSAMTIRAMRLRLVEPDAAGEYLAELRRAFASRAKSGGGPLHSERHAQVRRTRDGEEDVRRTRRREDLSWRIQQGGLRQRRSRPRTSIPSGRLSGEQQHLPRGQQRSGETDSRPAVNRFFADFCRIPTDVLEAKRLPDIDQLRRVEYKRRSQYWSD